MAHYRFKEKGPAYGLAHTEGEVVEFDPKSTVLAMPLVPELDRNGKPTNRMIYAKKEYTVDYLIESGVIVPATESDIAKFKKKEDINSKADALATKMATLEKQQFENRKAVTK